MRTGTENLGDIRILDVPGIVTLFALDGRVRARELKARFSVVKLGFIEFRDLRVFPKVFLMTRDARARCICEMETATASDLTLDFNVAGEALRAVDFLSAFMTLCAVGDTFEVGVGL